MSGTEAEKLYQKLEKEAAASGYLLNPDTEFVMDLMEGLITNQKRYGYLACPCRLAEGERAKDLDIICPCDYRDPDLAEHGACYCALYVSDAVARGEKQLQQVPERREATQPASRRTGSDTGQPWKDAAQPVWRCKVCGYLCARPQPPLKCPICKADQDRFERFS